MNTAIYMMIYMLAVKCWCYSAEISIHSVLHKSVLRGVSELRHSFWNAVDQSGVLPGLGN